MTATQMTAWTVTTPGPIHGSGPNGDSPLARVDKPVPSPGAGEVLIEVSACGVCRTDLHVCEGDLPVHRAHVTPGHEVVGAVVACGEGVDIALGTRVGVAWLRHTCGVCRYCLRGDENLCPSSRYTGWDADGGYAEYTVAPADYVYVYVLPEGFTDDMAPLLCAGIIGYRSLKRAELPPQGRLGLYGFGGSAHLCAQVALAAGAEVHVFTRGDDARRLARDLGAASVNGAYDPSPVPLDSAILFAPAGDLVPVCMTALDRGGTLAIAGIHLSDIPSLNYQDHLFQERQIRSVTANTRADGREFLELAVRERISVTSHHYPLARADAALRDLSDGVFDGAAVLYT
ncbi:zinc-binding alcohol dehydrogenase family protein [Gordonia jinhuaensis]|uniref:Probable alcohol dehydrogenase AdhA n=1 Tax=Gordonia jinhuaensis TaxID=1517702 RepID=A0A916T3U7_9ACTN|nr:zinc-binding alcohol dehydrogenase family protein [Gordonia jinhuaensis]GGB30770.1 alcohol dehydrogenase [Gordonia jinhuaensis]